MMSGKRFSFNDPQLKKLHEGLDKAFHTPPKPLAFLRSMTIMQKLFPKWSGAYEADEIERNLNEFFQVRLILFVCRLKKCIYFDFLSFIETENF